jgi:hypothetical protein
MENVVKEIREASKRDKNVLGYAILCVTGQPYFTFMSKLHERTSTYFDTLRLVIGVYNEYHKLRPITKISKHYVVDEFIKVATYFGYPMLTDICLKNNIFKKTSVYKTVLKGTLRTSGVHPYIRKLTETVEYRRLYTFMHMYPASKNKHATYMYYSIAISKYRTEYSCNLNRQLVRDAYDTVTNYVDLLREKERIPGVYEAIAKHNKLNRSLKTILEWRKPFFVAHSKMFVELYKESTEFKEILKDIDMFTEKHKTNGYKCGIDDLSYVLKRFSYGVIAEHIVNKNENHNIDSARIRMRITTFNVSGTGNINKFIETEAFAELYVMALYFDERGYNMKINILSKRD